MVMAAMVTDHKQPKASPLAYLFRGVRVAVFVATYASRGLFASWVSPVAPDTGGKTDTKTGSILQAFDKSLALGHAVT